MKVILASGSARRYEILKKHGIDPVVIPSGAEETLSPEIETGSVAEIVKYLASIKAQSVYEKLKLQAGKEISADEKVLILGADTIVYKDCIIGKPKDEQDAFAILSLLRNTSHIVFTGISLIDFATGEEIQFADETEVWFKDYPDEEIYRFISEEPPYDKSGSYAIQSSWAKNVDHILGDIENVIGLPWHRLAEYLVS